MPKIIFNLPQKIPETQKYEVNIDFDEASKKWRIHTAADNPRELRRRQRKFWSQVKSRPHRPSACLQEPQYGTEDDPITARIREAVLGYRENRRRSLRPRKRVKRLIEEL